MAATTCTVAIAQTAGSSCTVDAGYTRETLNHNEISRRVAERSIAVNDDMQKLMDSRDWKDGVPVGDQMTAAEAARFGNLQQQIKAGMVAMLAESKRDRDLRVLQRMSELARDASKPGYRLPQALATEDEILAVTLLSSRETESTTAEALAKMQIPDVCSFETALHLEARGTAEDVVKIYGINDAFADLDRLTTRYGAALEEAKLSPEDRRTRDRLAPVIQAAVAQVALARDLEYIARLEGVSKLMLEARRSAAYEAPGELLHWGVVWEDWVKAGRVTAEQNELTRTINLLDAKIPSDLINGLSKE